MKIIQAAIARNPVRTGKNCFIGDILSDITIGFFLIQIILSKNMTTFFFHKNFLG